MTASEGGISLAGVPIVVAPTAAVGARLAASELARYLYLLTGRISEVVQRLPNAGPAVVLDRDLAQSLGAGATDGELGNAGVVRGGLRRARPQFNLARHSPGRPAAGDSPGTPALISDKESTAHADC